MQRGEMGYSDSAKDSEKTREREAERPEEKTERGKGRGIRHKIAQWLREKDEREVRRRLRRVIGFLLTAAVAYLLGGAELLFGTFPLSLSLVCSTGRMLIPVGVGLLLSAWLGDLPALYGYVCLLVILLRVLATLLPALLRELSRARTETEEALIPYAPYAVEKVKEGENAENGERRERENLVAEQFRRLFCEDLSVKLVCAAVGGFLCGLLLLIEDGFSFYSACATLFLTVITPALVLALGGYFGEERYQRDWYALLTLGVLCGLCVLAAGDKTILGMPMAPFLAMLLTLSLSADKGVLMGLAAALLCGLAFDVIYLPLLLLSAVLFCLVSAVKRNAGVAVVCGLIVVWCYYVGGEQGLLQVLPPMLLALPLYMLVDKYREMMQAPLRPAVGLVEGVYFAEAVTEKTKNEAVKERLASLSETFASLSETFYKLSDRFRRPDVLGLKRITDHAFEETCEGCRNRELCWGADCAETLDAIRRVTAGLHTKGSCTAEDLPGAFLSRCLRTERLIGAVNAAVSDTTERIIKNGRNGFFAANYDDVTAILEDALGSRDEEYECDMELGGKVFDYLYTEGVSVGGVVVYGKRCRHVVAKGVSLSDDLCAERIEELRRRISELVGVELAEPVFEVGKDGTVMLLYSSPTVSVRCAHGRLSRSGKECFGDPVGVEGSEDRRETGEEDFVSVDPFAEEDDTCGDMTDAFITDNSYFYALISDGMGSGSEAAYTSAVCAMFIEKMLSAGNRADITLRMLNNVIRSENMGCGSECSATVDLLELDLMSGVASFIKSGAAPTYIARQGTVYKVSSRTMPVGIIKDADARITRFDTQKGDIIVMMSDGCCHDSEDCGWLVEYLCRFMSHGQRTVSLGDELCERLKDEILREAVKNAPEGEERDDISVSVTVVG